MKIQDYEIFKFGENHYIDFYNNDKKYLLNKRLYLDVVLGDFCNINCNFCIADLIHKKTTTNIETLKQKILFAVEKMNVKEVLLLGGEPTVHKSLIPIIQWLKLLNLDKIIITTNGIRISKDSSYCEELFSSGITHLNLSLMNLDVIKQMKINNSNDFISIENLQSIYQIANKNNVKLRINNNIFLGNNDSVEDIISFYVSVKNYCDSVKFSPLFKADAFSVIDYKTEWIKQNILSEDYTEELFLSLQNFYTSLYPIDIIENDLQFGFVKNTMIPLKVPIILNWNFGNYTGLMKYVINENKINSLKIIPNGELSLSWNRELSEYFIKTD